MFQKEKDIEESVVAEKSLGEEVIERIVDEDAAPEVELLEESLGEGVTERIENEDTAPEVGQNYDNRHSTGQVSRDLDVGVVAVGSPTGAAATQPTATPNAERLNFCSVQGSNNNCCCSTEHSRAPYSRG